MHETRCYLQMRLIFIRMGLLTNRSRMWGQEIPDFQEDALLDPANFAVLCALCAVSMVGPLLLEENVNSENYKAFLE